MYELHIYDAPDGFRWGVIAENNSKLASGGQGYSNREDLETVIGKMFLPAAGQFMGQHTPWTDCDLHPSKQGKCYRHKLTNASLLAQSLREASPGLGQVEL